MYGDAFRFDRVLSVFFYTSSTDKLLQARIIFVRSGYELRHYQAKSEPYDEDYSGDSEQLLTKAIRQVNAEFGIRSIFFVEDTSVRIEALSETNDFPGLATKEWFSETSFDELNSQIRLRGGNRLAVVKSDIALYLPTISRPLFFHGETRGQVAETAPAFEASEQYPWLTPATFNGWFVPEGARRRLGEMEFEESLLYDFRAKSLHALLLRLEELNAALNIGPSFYTKRQRTSGNSIQLPLLIDEHQQDILLVIGYKCAGKTTLADHVACLEGVKVYEASSVLRTLAVENERTISSSSDAHAFLSEFGLEAVGVRLSEYLCHSGSRTNIVTGLRTPEEILVLKMAFPNARVVLIEADPRVRFERHIRRARDPDVKTYRQFLDADEEQNRFGVMRVASELADVIIRNDSQLGTFSKRIDDVLFNPGRTGRRDGQPRRSTNLDVASELHRCLAALARIGRTATCQEISDATGTGVRRVRRYNTNRALKGAPEFADRITKSGTPLSYRVTKRGRVLLQLLDRPHPMAG
jgi:inosine/xanthosine triphosphate pyrophosphatase family protein/dephospho-CoA kinase